MPLTRKRFLKQSLHDLHECYKGEGMETARWVSTITTNEPYAMCRRKKQVHEQDHKYPRGTFFIITENGIRPEINKRKHENTNIQRAIR